MSDILADLLPEIAKAPADGPVMDFVVNKKDLEAALVQVESVVATKSLVKVLTNFFVAVEEDGVLRVVGSDSTISVVAWTKYLTTTKPGSAVFPTARFASIVREAPDGPIAVKVTRKKTLCIAKVRAGKTEWSFPLMDSDAFPDFAGVENFGLVEVNRAGFLAALQQVRKAASTDPIRPHLMLVDLTNGKMRASDSTRFQQVKFPFPFDCQIPVRAVTEIVQRLSAANQETISVGQTERALLFKFRPNSVLIAQKVVAKFPDMDEVLLKPTLSNDQELTVDRDELLKAVRRVRITADDTTAAVILSLNVGSISVESKDRNGGTAVETVAATWNNPPRHVSFNHQHLTDLLASSKSEQVTLRFGKDLKTRPTPLLMEDTGGLTAVLSQIRQDW